MSNISYREDQWSKIYRFLLADPHVYAGKESRCRLFLEAILWVARSGAQWRLLPLEYGNWNSVYKRFSRWEENGVWERMFTHFVEDPDWKMFPLTARLSERIPVQRVRKKKQRTRAKRSAN